MRSLAELLVSASHLDEQWGRCEPVAEPRGVPLGMVSISAGQASDEQISHQIEREFSKNEAFRDVTISVQEHVAFLNGAVPTLRAREQAVDEARTTTRCSTTSQGRSTTASSR